MSVSNRSIKKWSAAISLLIIILPFQNCGKMFDVHSLSSTRGVAEQPGTFSEAELIARLEKGRSQYRQSCEGCHGELSKTNIRNGDVESINRNLDTNNAMMSLRSYLKSEDIVNIGLALTKSPEKIICGPTYAAGRTTIHRLTNEEYNNTVRDLLFSKLKPADKFPPISAAISGFTNDSDALTIYEELLTSFYEASEQLAAEVIASKYVSGGAYRKIAPCALAAGFDMQSCASTSIQYLASRAFRRPISAAEQSRFVDVFNQSGDFDTGLSDVIISLLNNPKFIFVSISSARSKMDGSEFMISDFELASRLSYFLWQSMPDQELFDLAKANKLRNPTVLKLQVLRMMKDAKISAFIKVLTNEYGGLQKISSAPIPSLNENVRQAMLKETELFITDILQNDLSIINLVNGPFSYVNQDLASFYGFPFPGGDPNTFVKVSADVSGRYGIGSQGSVLTNTAGDTAYTHPVKRGKWVAKKVLCDEPPPPPPNLPMIDFETALGGSIRDKMNAHTSKASCIGCHKVMDNVGLGLENYDPFGRWRSNYSNNLAVDSTGVLPDGTAFQNAQDMYKKLGDSAQVRSCLPRQIMAYALTRSTTSKDDKCISQILGSTYVQQDSKLSDLITAIVMTNQFQKQTGESP